MRGAVQHRARAEPERGIEAIRHVSREKPLDRHVQTP
jgi:hypothetical protein